MYRSASSLFVSAALLTICFPASAEEAETKPVDEKLLTKVERDAFDQRRNDGLQKAFDRFPLIGIPPRGADQPKIHTIEMNRNPVIIDGWRYDGFRFRADLGKDPDLEKELTFVWGIVGFPELKSWYILPKEGTMKGFTHFMNEKKSDLRRIRDAAGPQNAPFHCQPLSASSLVDGAEYLIHIRFKNDQPINVTFVATFADMSAPETDTLLKALGCEEVGDD